MVISRGEGNFLCCNVLYKLAEGVWWTDLRAKHLTPYLPVRSLSINLLREFAFPQLTRQTRPLSFYACITRSTWPQFSIFSAPRKFVQREQRPHNPRLLTNTRHWHKKHHNQTRRPNPLNILYICRHFAQLSRQQARARQKTTRAKQTYHTSPGKSPRCPILPGREVREYGSCMHLAETSISATYPLKTPT
jgi:hypothetical protein